MTEHTNQNSGQAGNVPAISPDMVEREISSIHYFNALEATGGTLEGDEKGAEIKDGAALDRMTFCVIVLKNGHILTSYSIRPFGIEKDTQKARGAAREGALKSVWVSFWRSLKHTQTLYR